MSSYNRFLGCVICFAFLVSGCGLFGGETKYTKIDEDGNIVEEKKSSEMLPAQQFLTKGMDDYNVGKYYTAVENFEKILDRYPFSPEAVLAELKAADCKYFMEKYDEAEALYESFEDRHPTNESIPYVMYQKGMCNFRQIDRIDRDPSGAEKAVRLFSQLIKAFPYSSYTPDATEKLKIATDFLAAHEFSIVQFYLRTEKYPQAEARLRYLLAAYPNSPVAAKSRQLLNRLESGKPPKNWLTSLLPDFFRKDTEISDMDDSEAIVAPISKQD